jgi:HEAT repeat protein
MTMRTTWAMIVLLAAALVVAADEGWDARETRGVRQVIYPAIEHLPDFVQIKETFEKGLAGDATAAPALVTLVKHTNEDVAGTAAEMLGRFPSEAASAALKESYSADPRSIVRAHALAGLARMKDGATASLAIAALSGDDEPLQGAGLGALELLGDNTNSGAILQYLDRHPEEVSGDLLESLGQLGDPPGSTAVRDKLLAEANKKTNRFGLRYSAALGLQAMGLADLVKPLLDYSKAENTNSDMIVLKGAMERLAASRGVTIKGQADVDTLLRDADVTEKRYKTDLWKRPIRARFVSQGLFHVVSDGPDMTPDTSDDLSSGEAWTVYVRRVFPDLFVAR